MENWKPVSGFEGYYEVSDLGRVKSLERTVWVDRKRGDGYYRIVSPRFLRTTPGVKGYSSVALCKDGKDTVYSLHVLVATHFIGPRPEGYHCCHNDGDSTNNTAANLRWDTPQENIRDNWRHGKMEAVRLNGGHPAAWNSWSEEQKAEYRAEQGQRSKAMWEGRTQKDIEDLGRKISDNSHVRTAVEVTFADGAVKVYRSLTEARTELRCHVATLRAVAEGHTLRRKRTWTARYV